MPYRNILAWDIKSKEIETHAKKASKWSNTQSQSTLWRSVKKKKRKNNKIPKNKIANLTLDQIRAIYTAEIKNWKDLGGANKSIVLVSRDVSSGTFEVFKEIVLKGDAVHESAMKLASNQAVATTISNTADAIGYVGLGYVSSKVKSVKVDGVEASVATAQSKKYPITRGLHMYSNGTPTGTAKAYIDFIMSAEGQDMVSELGFVPVK
jgi:phosphate transport system substrate-binding protein